MGNLNTNAINIVSAELDVGRHPEDGPLREMIIIRTKYQEATEHDGQLVMLPDQLDGPIKENTLYTRSQIGNFTDVVELLSQYYSRRTFFKGLPLNK